MTDKKLTDKEIVKGLEYLKKCNNNEIDCDTCSLSVFFALCPEKIGELALDLINRLQARVKKCEKVEHFADKTIATLQAENERLKIVENGFIELQKLYRTAKVEAENKNIVHCKECKHLMFSDFEGECSKGYKGIVRPNDSCPFGVRERGESK